MDRRPEEGVAVIDATGSGQGECTASESSRGTERFGLPANRSRFLVGLIVGLAVLALAVVWLWSVSSPWDRPLHPLLLVPVAFGAFWVCSRGCERSVWRLVGSGALAIGAIALVVVAIVGTLGDARYDDRLSALDPVARNLLSDPGVDGCFAPTGVYTTLEFADLGTPNEICVSEYEDRGAGASQRVQFTWGARSLVFEGAEPHPSISQCYRHLRDQWWAQVEEDPDCPTGFRYKGL